MPNKPQYLTKDFAQKDLRLLIQSNPSMKHSVSAKRVIHAHQAKFILAEFTNSKKMYHKSHGLVWLTEEWCQLNELEYSTTVNGDGSVLVEIKEQ